MTEAQSSLQTSALADLKVVDISGPIGVYCAKLMADLGADVLRVEPPGGDPMRKLGPFYKDDAKPENSLYWWHFNTSKRGVTLDIEKPEGQALFKRLVTWADVVVESFEPGYLDRLGLGWEALHAVNPGLILTSITPFGQTGPYAHFKGPDIIGQAMSGIMNTVGLPDRAPYVIGHEMGYWTAGTLAADATMLAVAFRDIGGTGQHVDTSMQEAMAIGLVGSLQQYEVLGNLTSRGTLLPGRRSARSVYRCKDGWVFFIPAAVGTSMEAVRELFTECGFGEEFDPKWLDPNVIRTNDVEGAKFEALSDRFFAKYNKWELLDMAFNRPKPVFVTSTDTPEDVAKSPHLKARGFMQEVYHPELNKSFQYPGGPYKMPASPWQIQRRAPLIGEHNREIYRETLGLSEQELEKLKKQGVI